MDVKNFVGLLVFGVIGIIVLSAFVPIISETTSATKTFENEGYFKLDKYTDTDSYTFEWDYNDPSKFVINDETYEYTNTNGLTVSIILGEKFAIRLTNNNAGVSFFGGGNYINANATNPNLTVTYTGGTFTVTNGVNTRTISNVAEIYSFAEDGPYVMKKSTSPAYLNSGSEIIADSEIYASGQTFSGNNYIFWHMAGTIDDMEYPDTFDSALTVTNETIHGEYSNVCNDLYILDNITFTATSSNQAGITYNVTASYFVVPAEVTAEKSIHPDAVLSSVIDLLPLIAGIGLFIILVAGFLYSRYL